MIERVKLNIFINMVFNLFYFKQIEHLQTEFNKEELYAFFEKVRQTNL